MKCNASEIYQLPKIYGVARIVFYDGKPAVIRQKEIDAIRLFLREASGKVLAAGDEVEILTGAMKKISGKIMRIKKKYLVLHIEPLAATVCVNMDSVAPVNRIK